MTEAIKSLGVKALIYLTEIIALLQILFVNKPARCKLEGIFRGHTSGDAHQRRSFVIGTVHPTQVMT
jgi:hypothetical protein